MNFSHFLSQIHLQILILTFPFQAALKCTYFHSETMNIFSNPPTKLSLSQSVSLSLSLSVSLSLSSSLSLSPSLSLSSLSNSLRLSLQSLSLQMNGALCVRSQNLLPEEGSHYQPSYFQSALERKG